MPAKKKPAQEVEQALKQKKEKAPKPTYLFDLPYDINRPVELDFLYDWYDVKEQKSIPEQIAYLETELKKALKAKKPVLYYIYSQQSDVIKTTLINLLFKIRATGVPMEFKLKAVWSPQTHKHPLPGMDPNYEVVPPNTYHALVGVKGIDPDKAKRNELGEIEVDASNRNDALAFSGQHQNDLRRRRKQIYDIVPFSTLTPRTCTLEEALPVMQLYGYGCAKRSTGQAMGKFPDNWYIAQVS